MMDLDFNLIRGRVVIFSTVLVVCLILVFSTSVVLGSKRERNNVLEGRVASIHSQIRKLRNDVDLLDTYQHDYELIISRGFFLKESRLSWIEQLENTAARLQLNKMQYHIDPQQRVLESTFEIPANVGLFKSPLSFETGLLHEGDLVEIVDDLASLSTGLLLLDRCKVSLINKDLKNTSAYNFSASCDMSWYKANYQDGKSVQMSDEP